MILQGIAAKEADELLPPAYPLPSITHDIESACRRLHLDVPTLTDDELAWELFEVRERLRGARDRTESAWLEDRATRLVAEQQARHGAVPSAAATRSHAESFAPEALQPTTGVRAVLPPRPPGARHGR